MTKNWFRPMIVVAAVGSALTALAATSGAHFFSASGEVDGTAAMVVSFDEAGLGNEMVHYVLKASASATYACINGGLNHPRAANKETVAAQVTESADFEPKNGRVHGTMLSGPLSCPSSFTCPPGQTMVLACVKYAGAELSDETNGVETYIGTMDRTFVAIPGC